LKSKISGMIENVPGHEPFTIPDAQISAKWDLMYYFEILNRGGSGWFQPSPQVATPYYVVMVWSGLERATNSHFHSKRRT